jgi:hypothetical protein
MIKIKEDVMSRACSTHGEKRNVYRIFMGKQEGERSLGRTRSRWKVNIKRCLREVRWNGFVWLRMGNSGGLL